jgi:hypothetical protein
MAQSKVLSLFGSKNINSLFEDIELLGKPKDVFYEVQSYNILVSVYQDNNEKSNIFEETILKLLSIMELSIEKISEKLCLEKAFIKYLVESLEIKGLIDEEMKVTSSGRNLLESYNTDERKIEQRLFKIFVDFRTKQILPFIYTDIENFETESIENETKDRLEIKVGNKTDETIIKGRKIIFDGEDVLGIESFDIIKAIKKYNRIAEKTTYSKINWLGSSKIEITKSDKIFLHLQIGLQNGNIDEPFISDGFVPQIKLLLDTIKNSIIFKKIREQESSSTISYSQEKIGRENQNTLSELIKDINKEINYLQFLENNRDEIKERISREKDVVKNIFSLVEISLFTYLKENPLSNEKLNKFKENEPDVNLEILKKIALEIGLNIDEENSSREESLLLSFSRLRINNVFNTPNIKVLLPYIIIKAKYDSNNTFHKIVNENRNILKDLYCLKKMADSSGHTTKVDLLTLYNQYSFDNNKFNNSMDLINNIFEKYKKFIENLLNSKMSINKENQKVIIVEKDREVSSQKKLDADIELEKNLGNLYLYYLSNSLKDDFRMISPNKKESELPKGNDYIITLTRIIEDFLTYLDYEKIKYSNIEEAIQNIESFYGKKLSDSLRYTNSKRYINELKGEKSSLGAKAIVFLSSLKGDYESLLENLIKENFIELIEELIELRGHRNNIENNLKDIGEINLLRDRLFKSLKLIGGYCYGEE